MITYVIHSVGRWWYDIVHLDEKMYLANHLKKLNSGSKISYVKAWQLQVYVTIVTSAVSQSLATCLAAIFFVTGSLQL